MGIPVLNIPTSHIWWWSSGTGTKWGKSVYMIRKLGKSTQKVISKSNKSKWGGTRKIWLLISKEGDRRREHKELREQSKKVIRQRN